MPTLDDTAKELRKLALEYDIKVLLAKAPPDTRIIPLPYKPIIDFVDYEHALRSPAFIHERNCKSGDCFFCDNADAMIYETRRAKMLEEAGTDL